MINRYYGGFIGNYGRDITPHSHPKLDELAGYAIRYFEDFVKPYKVFRAPNDKERAAMQALYERLGQIEENADGDALQSEIFTIGKAHDFENLRDWFKALYQVLLGQDQGPRFGSFAALYGIEETRKLISDGLNGGVFGGRLSGSPTHFYWLVHTLSIGSPTRCALAILID